MITLKGKSVFGGVAIGKLSFYKRRQHTIKRSHVDDTAAEVQRFETARQAAMQELKQLYDKAMEEVGEANAAIFDIHQMMLEDPDYCESVAGIITTQQVNAEYAVGTTADHFAQMFASMDDAYMQGRATDVKDVSERVLGILSGAGADRVQQSDEPVIIAADDLVPSETVQLDKSRVLGFATMYGSSNSHTAILARTMGLPAVIGLKESLTPEFDGHLAVIDGFTGTVSIDPDEQTLAQMRKRQQEDTERKALLQRLKGQDNVTLDGQHIKVYANIGNLSDVGSVLQNDAQGIGLFRSEFLYLENNDFPSEEQQFNVYKTVAEMMAGKKVIIRTLDIGADKKVDYFGLEDEENPALGYRAVRICLTRQDIFKTQLRALYRASAYGEIAIMIPMIISVDEVRAVKEIAAEVREELRGEGLPFSARVELGIMIETPAAVMMSAELAREVDFFSVGTNDLTQYTLAIDRQNPRLDAFYNPHHPAVLRMIRTAADNAHKAEIWIGICGELGGDPELTAAFLAMGIDELSVSPGLVLGLRKTIRETDVGAVRDEVLASF
jgi:phosphotransferase system enzyme I (PtsI)